MPIIYPPVSLINFKLMLRREKNRIVSTCCDGQGGSPFKGVTPTKQWWAGGTQKSTMQTPTPTPLSAAEKKKIIQEQVQKQVDHTMRNISAAGDKLNQGYNINYSTSNDINRVFNTPTTISAPRTPLEEIKNAVVNANPSGGGIFIKAMKKDVSKVYPLTEAGKKRLAEMETKDRRLMGINPEGTLKKGATAAGIYYPRGYNSTANKFYRALDKVGLLDTYAEHAPKIVDKVINKLARKTPEIGLDSNDPEVLSHELLHDVFDTSFAKKPQMVRIFNHIWEKYAAQDPLMQDIDSRLARSYSAKTPSATERFAFYGSQAGSLEAMPPELRVFYREIFFE